MQGPADARSRSRTPLPSRLHAWLADGPAYPPDAADLRTVSLLGLRLPVRATVAVLVVAGLLLLDYHGRIDDLVRAVAGPFGDTASDAKRVTAIGRLLLQGLVPLLVVVVAFRDRPARYGIRVGDWRAGIVLAAVGCAVMTPVVVGFATQPASAAYYAPLAASPGDVVLTAALEVIPAEFFYRGFLLFALLRVVGPIAVVLATLPFAFAHLGKPEVETLSTLAGGIAYGWLDWRTGSVLWSGLAHTWILALAIIVAGITTGTTA